MTSSDPPDSPFETDLGDDPFSTQRSDVGREQNLASSVRRLGNYQLLRQLGRGGMGVVYEAVHASGGPPVALKTLQQQSASAIHRFKDEFRVLADLSHKNLVRLGELVTTADEPFFTMEIIQGKPFDEFVSATFASAEALPNLPFNERLLRDALTQLAEGLATLHMAGCIHRDLKPTNVLVTSEGRVVILDFGLALDRDDASYEENQSSFVGTPYYMSPEQARSTSVTTASDWYSVGIMLYEVLTSERAFQSRQLSELMREKLESQSLCPREVQPEVPSDLSQLCVDLLQVDPELRPDGNEVLRRLSGTKSNEVNDQVWIGRTDELAQLSNAWHDVRQGDTRVVLVSGNSGMGKTSLVDRFLTKLRRDEPVIVLRGRCYDNESVAYQGFDSIVDSLSDHLRRMPAPEVERLLPMELDSLTQIFPVLCEVPSIARDVTTHSNKTANAAERRRLGMSALREMLSRLCRWHAVVIFIDDLQQGDADTASLFREMFLRDQAPHALFVGTYRTEDEATSECLRQIRRNQLPATEQLQLCDQIEISVDRFNREDSVRLANGLLVHGGVNSSTLSEQIVEEAAGDPLFIRLLARHFLSDALPSSNKSGAGNEKWTLSNVIWNQVSQLDSSLRAAIEVLAAAGRPVDQRALEAALENEAPVGLVRSLRAKRLVRRLGDHQSIETFHDKIRETVREKMPQERVRRHCIALADHLESSIEPDVEFLADLYRRGDMLEKSGEYYLQAAAIANRSLAFNRAVEYYRHALSQLTFSRPREIEVRRQLGDALANASRAAESAEQYLAAGLLSDGDERASLHQQAALRWLTSGHVDQGVAALKVALEAHRLPWPQTTAHAVYGLLKRNLQLRLRGLHRSQRGPLIDATSQARLDVCWSAAAGLSVVDPIRGSYFVAENLYQALSYQGSKTLVRDLAAYIGHVAIPGNRGRRQTRRVLLASRELVRGSSDPHSRAMLFLARGIAALLRGEWAKTIRCCDHAVVHLNHEQIRGATWELSTARTFALWALQYQGNFVELARRQPELMRIAQETNDLFATLNFGTQVMTNLQLAADNPNEALRRLEEDRSRLSDRGFFVQHHNQLLATVCTRLYQRRGIQSLQLLDGQWSHYRRAFLSQVQQIRIDHCQVAARAHLAAAAELSATDPAKSKTVLANARKIVSRLHREKVDWSVALATAFDAAALHLNGDRTNAIAQLRLAAEKLHKVDMRLFAAAASHHLANLDASVSAQASVDEQWASLGIADPTAMANMLIPGFTAAEAS